MKATFLRGGIIHLEYPTQRDLCQAMVRVQEFYESPYPAIQGQHVDLSLLKKLYAETHGSWSYDTDWHGFNVPGDVVDAFFEKHSATLRVEEEQILNALACLTPNADAKFYLIGTHADDPDKSTLPHEMAHAFYGLDPDYRARVQDLLRQARMAHPGAYEALAAWLISSGYSREVLDDEMHAYLATTPAEYWEQPECCGLPGTDLWNAGHDLRALLEGRSHG